MFSGIIEHLGVVAAVEPDASGKILTIESGPLAEEAIPGDSLAVNGVCLTALCVQDQCYRLQVVGETLSKTNLGELKKGDVVNLERPLKADGRLHGHWVLGHVDATTLVSAVQSRPEGVLMSFALNSGISPFLVPRGSVTIDGVSLTVAGLGQDGNSFSCALIGFTLEHTTLGQVKSGSKVNVETDIIGKYVVGARRAQGEGPKDISASRLRELGY